MQCHKNSFKLFTESTEEVHYLCTKYICIDSKRKSFFCCLPSKIFKHVYFFRLDSRKEGRSWVLSLCLSDWRKIDDICRYNEDFGVKYVPIQMSKQYVIMAKKYYAMEENHIKIFRENPTYYYKSSKFTHMDSGRSICTMTGRIL